MRAIVKDSEVRGLKDGTWRVRGSEMWMLVAGDLSRIIHFPAIIQSIISPEQTVGSSKLKVTLWWAPPSRVWCMCACVCEMDWRALTSHTHRHTVTCCWAELKSAHGHIKTVIRAQGRGKRIRWGIFFHKVTSAKAGNSQPSVWTDRAAEPPGALCACVYVCEWSPWLLRLFIGYL